jgi:hypothetical protein
MALDSGKIRDGAALKDLFLGLLKDKPVAVYSNTGIKHLFCGMLWNCKDMIPGYMLEITGKSLIYALLDP